MVHLILSSLAVSAGILLRISSVEWLILVWTITTGLVIEIVNTAIEATVDLMTEEYHIMAKIAKDTASAAMLVYSFGALLVAALIFVPKIWLFS